jgi:hypothetical protein
MLTQNSLYYFCTFKIISHSSDIILKDSNMTEIAEESRNLLKA